MGRVPSVPYKATKAWWSQLSGLSYDYINSQWLDLSSRLPTTMAPLLRPLGGH